MADTPQGFDSTEDRNAAVQRRTLLVFLLFITLVFVVGGALLYDSEARHIESEKYQELKTIADLKVAQIDGWRKERFAALRKSLQSPYFRDAVEAFRNDPHNGELQRRMRERLQAELDDATNVDALLVTLDGRVLVSASPLPDPVSGAEGEAIRESLAGGKVVIGSFYRSERGRIYVDTVGPVSGAQGKPVAILILRSDPASVLYPLINTWPSFSKSAETFIVRRDGKDVLFLNELRHHKGAALSIRIPLTAIDVPAVQAVLGRKGLFRGRDYRGVEVLAVLHPIEGSPWFMVAKVDVAEVLSEARYHALVISAVVFLIILLSAAVAAYAYRYRQAGLYKSLYRTERTRREVYELFRTTLYSIGDAVITTDSEGRVKNMNAVAEQLTGWPEGEAEDRPLREVFHIANETTRKDAENPVDRVLREGKVVGLANHTVLIGRDGIEYPIADSGAPIRSATGDINGVVLVFRDQTKEREAESALRESEEKYRNFFMTSRDFVFIASPGEHLIDFNDAAYEFFGYEGREEFSRVPVPMLYEHPEDRAAVHRLIAEKGYIKELPIRMKKKDGSVVDGLVTATMITNEDGSAKAYIGTIRDVTEQKKMQDALHESEQKYRRLFEDAALGAFRSTLSGQLITINPAYARMFGYRSPEELIAAVTDMSSDIYAEPSCRETLVKTVEERDGPVEMECMLRRKDGSTFMGHLHVRLASDGAGEPTLEGFIEDISTRKAAEQAIQTSLREKETLLKEIHHRVKNNLQIMSSLLNLQTQHVNDPEALSALRVSVDRIRSMALIHDKLYRSETLSSIYFPGYIGDLARNLVSTYAMGKGVTLNLDVDPVSFEIETAMPLGLIINELVTNSLKHGFPGEERGTITIGLHVDGDHGSLEVSDTGIGFPDDVDFRETQSMGMQLVVILVEQLDGTVELSKDKGTEFIISFTAESRSQG